MSNLEPFYIQLKAHREAQKITLEEISKRTKIKLSFLESIENGDFDILPKTYLRLFLKSYSIEIGIDPIKSLENYEILSYGQVKPKSQENLIHKQINAEDHINKNNLKFNYNRKKIISITLSLISIYIFFTFISNLNNTIQTNSITEIDTLYNPLIINDSLIIPDFSEKLFNKSNLIGIDNIKLPINPPFTFNAKAINNTRMHYRIEENTLSVTDTNIVIPKNTYITLEYSGTIYFDILNCSDLEFSINNIRIDNRINCNKSLLRASIDSLGAVNATFYLN